MLLSFNNCRIIADNMGFTLVRSSEGATITNCKGVSGIAIAISADSIDSADFIGLLDKAYSFECNRGQSKLVS